MVNSFFKQAILGLNVYSGLFYYISGYDEKNCSPFPNFILHLRLMHICMLDNHIAICNDFHIAIGLQIFNHRHL